MADPPRGLLDTSVVVDLESIRPSALPVEVAISAITLAELAAGPVAARAYARIYSAVVTAGRKPRSARSVDLLIAASAPAEQLPLFTRNPRDFAALHGLVEIHAV